MSKPNDQRRRAALIRRSLFMAGISQSAIARKVGVTRGLVCHVIGGRRRHAGVRKALARAVGMSVRDLWEE